ncbi:MAG: signal recognition particle receptor subunit alpha, partial [Halobacteriota archaeon]
MFESLRQKLNQFKQTVNNKERELDDAEVETSANDITPLAEGPEEATSEAITPPAANVDETIKAPQPVEAPTQEVMPSETEKPTRGKSLFERELKEKDLEEPLWDLEIALLESDVAMSVSEEIVGTVKRELIGTKRKWRQDIGALVEKALRDGILKVLDVNGLDFDELIKQAPKPVTIVFTGINGTGKTTTIAKVAYRLKNQGYAVVLAAGDTYRAGALEQIERHAENLCVKLIKHQQGADPAAVIYDAVQYAHAKHKDVVLADTAGRIHTNVNLMNQLKKIERVIDADLVVFVDEALAG